MITFLGKRIGLAIFVVAAVTTLAFFVMHSTGDPVGVALTGAGVSADDIARIKHELGYDRPLIVQFGSFLAGVFRGDFGNSFQYGEPSLKLIMERVPNTLILAGTALALTIVVAIPMGIAASARRGGIIDQIVMVIAAIGQSVPSFVVGPILILLFAVNLQWFPVAGTGTFSAVVLPAITLALYPIARVARLLRGSMLDTAGADFITTAEAKGVGPVKVIMRHQLRNALLPVLTVISMQIAQMLGGAIIVESIFGWPGIGSMARDALINSDFALAQTIIILIATAVVLINLLTDLLYTVVDPRSRMA